MAVVFGDVRPSVRPSVCNAPPTFPHHQKTVLRKNVTMRFQPRKGTSYSEYHGLINLFWREEIDVPSVVIYGFMLRIT